MRFHSLLVALPLLAASVPPASAAVSVGVGISLPGVQIGVNLPAFPDLQPVPNYPVYYAPGVNGNYFFYDGMYWVYADDTWYSSSWYNGPWYGVAPEQVPLFVLRVPVRYYRVQPAYFRGWQPDAAPRWDAHWGPQWVEHHRDWDRWDRRQAPPPAPLPTYQRGYAGSRYPSANQQREIRVEHYHFQPHDPQVRQRFVAERQAAATIPSSGGPREPAQTAQPQHREQQAQLQAEQQRAQQAQAQRAEQQRATQARDAQQRRAEQQQRAQPLEQRAQQTQAQPQQRGEQQRHAQQPAEQPRSQQVQAQQQQRAEQQRAQQAGAQQREEQQRRAEKGQDRRPAERDSRGG